jgi:hypothetical protein
MNLLEQQLHRPLGETLLDSGTTLEVAPGVRWIRMDLPGLRVVVTRMRQTTFAMGEAIAHLHRLWFEERLQRRLGADGICRFSCSAP